MYLGLRFSHLTTWLEPQGVGRKKSSSILQSRRIICVQVTRGLAGYKASVLFFGDFLFLFCRLLQRHFQVSPKLLGFGEACPGVLKIKVCQWFGFVLRLCSWSRMPAWICMHLASRTSWYFHMYKPQTNLVNVCAQLISLRNEHFFGDTFDVLCCHMYKPNQTSIQAAEKIYSSRAKKEN